MSDLETEWRKSSPCCLTCGWCPAFYEIEDFLELDPDASNATQDCYWSPCIAKEDEDAWSHKGYYLYVEKAHPPESEKP